MHRFLLVLAFVVSPPLVARAEITRVWLSHRSADPTKLVVNWESPQPGNSIVRYESPGGPAQTVRVEENVTLHHIEIQLVTGAATYRYTVQTGDDRSAEAAFKTYPDDVLRAAIVGDWQGRPKLDAILADDVHLLLTVGDNIGSLHERCGEGVVDCTKPYGELIDAYPALFRSVRFMPVLGNHDREIRPRGDKPPSEPVYDIEATAFRKFFELPGDEWKWHFDVPRFGVRFVGLDLNHMGDLGTTWQTCHPLDKNSEQFKWYEQLMTGDKPPLVVTLHNENNGAMRNREGGAWGKLFSRGTIAVSGFGYYAERAEADGFTYYNTALGVGAKYPDRQMKFFESTASYVLLTITPGKMIAELKSLDGRVLDRKEFAAGK